MQKHKLKILVLLFGLLLPTIDYQAMAVNMVDGHSHIVVKGAHVEGAPKGSSIQASINGHYLSVTFTENLGQVSVTLTTASGAPVDGQSVLTPTGFMIYIPLAGDYIITFTLPNGDEYYGEFTVTD